MDYSVFTVQITKIIHNNPFLCLPPVSSFLKAPDFQRKLMSILFKLVNKRETEGTLLNSFYEATVTLIAKTKSQQRKIFRPISLMYIDATIINKIL